MKIKVPYIVQWMALIVILLTPFQSVNAQFDCDSTIVDSAGVFGNDIGRVESAVAELQRYAEVRVLTIQSYNTATLDQYISDVRQQCPSWQATDGGFKNNLIVFAISLDQRDTGIFYGNQWSNPLDANWTRVVSDFMNPRFGDGDFAGGFAAGVNEVSRLVDLKVHPPTQAPPSSGPVIVETREPVDLSGFFRFLMYALLAVFVIVVGYLAYRFYERWVKENEAKRKAQQSAKLKKQAVTSRISAWRSAFEGVETDIAGLASIVDESVLERLNSMLREAQRRYDQMLRRYNGLDSSAGDPNTNGLTAGQYVAIERAYAEILTLLESAQDELAEATEAYVEVKLAAGKAPQALSDAEKAFEAARQAAADMSKEFGVDPSVLAPIEKLVESARKSNSGKRPDLAYQRAVEATETAKELTKSLRALPERKAAIKRFIASLPDTIQRCQTQIANGRELFDDMDDVYPSDALEPIAGNGTEAEKRVSALMDAQEDLGTMLDKQQFEKAEALIEKAKTWIAEIDSFMRSIVSLKKSLDEAAKTMKAETVAAATDIKAAQGFLRARRSDLDGNEHDLALREAEKSLRAAIQEMDEAQPNPVKVVKFARQANEQADRVLAAARQEAEQTARLRVKAETAIREAERLVSKASEYIEDHSSNVESNAKANLRAAKKDLQTARDAGDDLQRRINFAEGAEVKARDAYEEAKDDVSDAREAAYSSDDDTTVVVWGGSTPVRQPSTSRPSSNWTAPVSRPAGGGSLNWGGSSQRGSSISIPKSTMGGGSKKW